ncbi:L-alanine exporter AlaE [Jannaschia marina]|uniref:L-alanine exporter AlaE n=1 Tax=Jannaschia marina TaxID=2741674 RepID=UPI0015CBF1FA|nr:L-alanine exporter AlaE [Jannaschia marina]
MRAFLVDTLTTIVFFTVVAAVVELWIVGLDPAQVLVTRALTIPVMVLTGRPYGRWRDLLMVWVYPQRAITRAAVDTVAFLSFQMPIYALTLFVAGATLAEVLVALPTASLTMVVLARPFGLVLDAVRRIAGTAPY